MRHIEYAIDKTDGVVYSRVGSEIAGPVIDFDKIGEGGDFTQPIEYKLVKCPVASYWPNLRWTRKIPVDLKNRHRDFWGMRALADEPR